MTTWRPQLIKEKYKQVIPFLLNSDANNVRLGKVKLFKLLYYVDFDHFQEFKSSVTGDWYRKLPYGPVPVNAQDLLYEMRSEERIAIEKQPVGDVCQGRKKVYH